MPPQIPRLTELSDEDLMIRYAQGGEAEFEVLLSRFRRPLFGFLCRMLGRTDKAEDVFQEVFYEVIRGRRQYRPDAKFSAWIYRIARNRAVDRLRRDSFREMTSLDELVDQDNENGRTRLTRMEAQAPNPEELMQCLELETAVEKALASLPVEQREVFWLKEKSNLTLAEVAAVTGVSLNTVKSRLRYALEKIRTELTRRGFQS